MADAAAAASPVWVKVQPEGLALALLVVTIILVIICVVVVGLRIFVRIRVGLFGLEDYLMCMAMGLNTVHNGIVIYGTFTGIGTPDDKLEPGTMMEGGKIVLLWQLFYVTSSIFIKASICATLMRIAVQRRHFYALCVLIALTVIANLVAFSAALARCHPVAAGWNPALGTCLDQSIIVTLTYVVSAVNIFTDWSVAIIPVFILWNVQMRPKLKLLTGGILGIGVLASAATIIRMPYTKVYNTTVNQLHGLGNIILWTVVECSLGVIAGSLPMLRTLFKGLSKDYSSSEGYRHYDRSNDNNLVTIGRLKNKKGRPMDDTMHSTVHAADNDSHQDMDGDSTRNIITVTKEFATTSDQNSMKLNRAGMYDLGQVDSRYMKR